LRTKLRWLGFAWLVALAGNANAENMSVNCEFGLLKQAHETLVFCGEQIDPASEARYDKLKNEFSSFIAANIDSKKASDDSVEDIRRRLLQNGRERACKDRGYPLLRRAFFHYTSDIGMDGVSNLLNRARDPSEGGCF